MHISRNLSAGLVCEGGGFGSLCIGGFSMKLAYRTVHTTTAQATCGGDRVAIQSVVRSLGENQSGMWQRRFPYPP
jgi:hypothetical protein